jgi:hypothetical protein
MKRGIDGYVLYKTLLHILHRYHVEFLNAFPRKKRIHNKNEPSFEHRECNFYDFRSLLILYIIYIEK